MLCPPGAEGHACMDKCATGLKCQQFPGAVCRVNNCTSNCRIEFYIAKSWSPEEYCFPDVWIPPPSNSVLHVAKILSPLFWIPEKSHFHRPQGKVMFSQVSFCPQSASWLLGHCSSLLERGRYTSYWNAFLLEEKSLENIEHKTFTGMHLCFRRSCSNGMSVGHATLGQ